MWLKSTWVQQRGQEDVPRDERHTWQIVCPHSCEPACGEEHKAQHRPLAAVADPRRQSAAVVPFWYAALPRRCCWHVPKSAPSAATECLRQTLLFSLLPNHSHAAGCWSNNEYSWIGVVVVVLLLLLCWVVNEEDAVNGVVGGWIGDCCCCLFENLTLVLELLLLVLSLPLSTAVDIGWIRSAVKDDMDDAMIRANMWVWLRCNLGFDSTLLVHDGVEKKEEEKWNEWVLCVFKCVGQVLWNVCENGGLSLDHRIFIYVIERMSLLCIVYMLGRYGWNCNQRG